MTRVRGMSVTQFKEAIEDMRKIVDFTDEEAKIINLQDVMCDANRQIDITFTRNDDIRVNLSKGIPLDLLGDW